MRKSKATYDSTGKYYTRTPKSDARFNIVEEIGDSKNSKFQPQIKIMGWDNECNVSFRLVTNGNDTHSQNTDGTITSQSGNFRSAFYPVDEQGEHGGHEFETLIVSKPNTNTLKYTIQSKNVDFFYQPALTSDEIAQGFQRPENVVGSYAVYGKNRDNHANGKQYFTGKLMHIYRPFAVDANGKRVWCELNINEANTLMTITIPQDFINTAVYPILIDPTMGYTTVGGSISGNAQPWATGPYAALFPIRFSSITIFGSGDGANVPFIAGLYSNNSSFTPNRPENLLATSASGTFLASTGSWRTVSLDYKNTTHANLWVAHNAGNTSPQILSYIWYDAAGGSGLVLWGDNNGAHNFSYPSMFNPFVCGGFSNNRVSAYATFELDYSGEFDYNLFGSPLPPIANANIDVESFEVTQYSSPFVYYASAITNNIVKIANVSLTSIVKIAKVTVSTISKIAGVNK